jgi:hypothetical protein
MPGIHALANHQRGKDLDGRVKPGHDEYLDPCYHPAMTKLLRKAIEEVERLPASEQDAAAGALMDYLDHMHGLHLSDEQVAEIKSRLAAPGTAIPLSEARERLQRAGQ